MEANWCMGVYMAHFKDSHFCTASCFPHWICTLEGALSSSVHWKGILEETLSCCIYHRGTQEGVSLKTLFIQLELEYQLNILRTDKSLFKPIQSVCFLHHHATAHCLCGQLTEWKWSFNYSTFEAKTIFQKRIIHLESHHTVIEGNQTFEPCVGPSQHTRNEV